jgi:hypothetical protein
VTTAAAPVRERAYRLGLAVRGDTLALIGLAALSGLLVALTWGTWGDPGSDTGYDLVAGERVADGQFPYADFTYFYGPLAPFLIGVASLLGGGGLAPAIGLGLVLAGAVVGLTYALGRMLAGTTGGFLAAALTAPVAFGPSNFSFVLPHTSSTTIAVLGALVFLLGLSRYGQTGLGSWLFVAGTAAGLVALTRPEFELAVLLAAGVWLALRHRFGAATRRELVLLAGPALAVPALIYGTFLTTISPSRLLFDNLYPVDELRAGGSEIIRLHAPLTVASFAELGLKLVLYAAGAALLVAAGRLLWRQGQPSRSVLMLGAAALGLVAIVSVAREETVRYGLEFAYGWIPAGAVIAATVLVWRAARRPARFDAVAQAAAAGAVVLAVLAVKTYAGFFVHSSVPQLAVYALPFAAVFLVRLHLVELVGARRGAYVLGSLWLAFLTCAGVGLTLKDARAESVEMRGPGGALRAQPAQASLYQGALDWIARKTAPGDPILVAPQLTALYTLSERENPLPEISLLPGALPTAAAERTAIARLEEAGVRLAVIDRRAFPEYGHTTFGGSFDRVLDSWVQGRFVRAATLRALGSDPRTIEIWLRRGSS